MRSSYGVTACLVALCSVVSAQTDSALARNAPSTDPFTSCPAQREWVENIMGTPASQLNAMVESIRSAAQDRNAQQLFSLMGRNVSVYETGRPPLRVSGRRRIVRLLARLLNTSWRDRLLTANMCTSRVVADEGLVVGGALIIDELDRAPKIHVIFISDYDAD